MPTSTAASPSTEERRAYMRAFRSRQKSEGVRRITVNLSAAEAKRLSAFGKKHGEPKLAAQLKTLALAHLDNRYLVPPELAERLDVLVTLLRNIGNNVNQLARHSNEMRAFLETAEVRGELKRLEAAVRDFVEKPPSSAPARAAGEGG